MGKMFAALEEQLDHIDLVAVGIVSVAAAVVVDLGIEDAFLPFHWKVHLSSCHPGFSVALVIAPLVAFLVAFCLALIAPGEVAPVSDGECLLDIHVFAARKRQARNMS